MEYSKALKGIPEHLKYDYHAIKQALKQFVGEDICRDGSHAEEFWKRSRGHNEKIQLYAADLRELGKRAFLNDSNMTFSNESYEKTLLTKFLSGLNSPNLERWVFQQKPSDLNEAINAVLQYETFEVKSTKPKAYQEKGQTTQKFYPGPQPT